MELGIVYYISKLQRRGVIVCKDDTIKFFDIHECHGIKENDYVTFEIDTYNPDKAHILKPLRKYPVLNGYFHQYQQVEGKGIHNEDFINLNSPGYGTTIRDTSSSEMDKTHEKRLSVEERCLVNTFINKQDKIEINTQTLEEKGKEIWDYIDNLNLDEIVASFKIIVEEFFHHKPGDDDRYSVDKIYSVNTKDEYITSLLPNKTEELYSDRGFCTAESMRTYTDEQTGRQYREEEKYKLHFKKVYNRHHHFYILLNNYIQKVLKYNEELLHQEKILAEYYPIDKVNYYFKHHDCHLSTSKSKTIEQFVDLYNHHRE